VIEPEKKEEDDETKENDADLVALLREAQRQKRSLIPEPVDLAEEEKELISDIESCVEFGKFTADCIFKHVLRSILPNTQLYLGENIINEDGCRFVVFVNTNSEIEEFSLFIDDIPINKQQRTKMFQSKIPQRTVQEINEIEKKYLKKFRFSIKAYICNLLGVSKRIFSE